MIALSATVVGLLLATPFPTAAMTEAEECAKRIDDAAVEICRKAAKANPSNTVILRNLVRRLISNGAFEEAAEVQSRIADLMPNDWAANYDYAGTLGFVRRYHDAIAPITKASKLRPDHIPTYETAALIYTMIGQHAEARAQTEKAADLGSVVAMYDMVRYYEQGLGVPKSNADILKWTKRAAENGHMFAMTRMIEIHLEGEYGQAPNESKAEEWAARHRAAKERQ